jgi:lipopolysaccharide assembly protein A
MFLIVLAVFILLVFKIQNLSVEMVSILGSDFTMPVSILVLAVYFLGAFTGGAVFGLVRSWLQGARDKPGA